MKRTTIVLPILLLFFTSLTSGQPLTGKDVIKKVNDLFNPHTTYSKSKMTIVTSSGQNRTFVSESWSKDGGEKTLIRYLEPKRVKGQAVLMLNNADDIWMFFPRTRRVRKLASHAKKQKVQGGDFSYEDMGSGDSFIEDYIPKRLNDEEIEGHECFKIVLKKKPESDLSYSKLVMWVIRKSFVPVVIDYYDEDNPKRVEKRLVQYNIKKIDKIPTAMKAVMYNRNDNTKTKVEIVKVRYNLKLKDSMFTERSLKK